MSVVSVGRLRFPSARYRYDIVFFAFKRELVAEFVRARPPRGPCAAKMRTTTVHPLGVRAENDPASPARASGLLVPSACAASPLTRARFPGISLGADRRGDRFGRPPRVRRAPIDAARIVLRRRVSALPPLVPDICRFGVPRHPSPPPAPDADAPRDATPRRSTPEELEAERALEMLRGDVTVETPKPGVFDTPLLPAPKDSTIPCASRPPARARPPPSARPSHAVRVYAGDGASPRRPKRGATSSYSRYRGVSVYRRTGRWEAHIWHDGKQRHLGTFGDAESAARAYDKAAMRFRGAAGTGRLELNFPRTEYDGDAELKGMLRADGEVFVRWLRASSKKRARDAA